MLMVIRFCSPPYSASASASAVSVLPTPDGPHSMNTPTGLPGLSSPAREVCTRRAIISSAWSWPITRRPSVSASSAPPRPRCVTIRPTGMPGPVADHRGHRLLIDARQDQRRLALVRGKLRLQRRAAPPASAARASRSAPVRARIAQLRTQRSTWSTSAFSASQRVFQLRQRAPARAPAPRAPRPRVRRRRCRSRSRAR